MRRDEEVGEVFLTETSDRNAGIRSLLGRYDLSEYSGRRVALKANFNSADPFPASTHIDTLGAIVKGLKGAGVSKITLAERSGMGDTRTILKSMGVFELSEELGFGVVVLDEEDRDGWTKIERDGNHWLRGFYISRVFLQADRVVQICCLKTHRFGGHFTMSLKNSVGLVAKKVPGGLYDYMLELHGSPFQKLMIAEINKFYDVDLVVMDAMRAFVNRGPERGDLVEPNLLLAGRDRVAIDATGVAILRIYGSTRNVMKGRIFDLAQIRRAAELGIGVESPEDIRLTPIDERSRAIANEIERVLEEQG
ncbi:MAG: DUF362 domain-containing protein [Candidatus Bathyarchaeota archaeon]|nr:DUF362 domain-containing protein [Candidatus Bathyarchaeota archaeon]